MIEDSTMGKRSLDDMSGSSGGEEIHHNNVPPVVASSSSSPFLQASATTTGVDDDPMDTSVVELVVEGQKSSPTTRGSILTLLSRPSPFANETGSLPVGEFEPIPPTTTTATATTTTTTVPVVETSLSKSKVLVVGAGGLGCEVLKDLAMSGITDVHVIDLDTIDVTNLNRQFLFRQKDVGSSKAVVAANFINERCPWMNVVPHHGMIQDKDPSFYSSFNVIISGLDNVEARRWLNATVCGLVEVDDDGDPDPTTIIPIVDGGTVGRIVLCIVNVLCVVSLHSLLSFLSFFLSTYVAPPLSIHGNVT